jgi:hypothetical protein
MAGLRPGHPRLSWSQDVDARHRRQVYAVCARQTAMAGHDGKHAFAPSPRHAPEPRRRMSSWRPGTARRSFLIKSESGRAGTRSGRSSRPHRRDQVAADPAARTRCADGWAGCDREGVVARIARLLNIEAEIRFKFQTADTRPHSRGGRRPRFAFRCPSKEGAGNAGCALHPRSRVQKAERKSHTSIQGSGGNPTFPAQWLYGLLRALPGESGFVVSVVCE